MSDKKKKSSYSTLTGFHRAVPIILAAVAVFIGLCFVTQDIGSLGRAISGVLLGLFSWGAYTIPALIGLHALFYASDIGAKRALTRIIFSIVAVVTISTFAHAVRYWGNADVTFNIVEFYKNGKEAIGGGVIGGFFGFGIIEVIGSVGVIILAVTILAIYLTYFFSSGMKVIGRVCYGALKGLVYFCAWVEKAIKKAFGSQRREEKKARAMEEKNRALLDDEFFDVDNGLEHLEISDLGISETKDKASMEGHTPLRDKVHHKSEASPDEILEMERKARERAAASATYYEDVTVKAEAKGFVIEDTDFIERKPRTAEVKSESILGKEPSADEIFTAEFDPYELAMSEKLAAKRSSRSLLDEKPTVREDISELTEEDAERARRNAQFERRKATVVANATAGATVSETEDKPKTVEYSTPYHSADASINEDHTTESVVIEKPTVTEPKSTVYTVDTPYVVASPKKEDDAVAVVGTVSNINDGYSATEPIATKTGAKAIYRRAAEFASATVEKHESPRATPSPTYIYPKEEFKEPERSVIEDRTPTTAYSYNAPSAGYTVPRKDVKDTADYNESTETSHDTAYVTSSFVEDDDNYTKPESAEDDIVTPEISTTTKPEYNFAFGDEDEKDVYTPSFNDTDVNRGEYSTEEKDVEDSQPSFKEYEGANDGGLVFEFDMSKVEERKTLSTETTIYGVVDEEDDEEDESVIDEVVEDDTPEEDIPPEKQNPVVAEMRDLFPALRESSPSVDEVKVDTFDEDSTEEITEEDNPPFDDPIVAVSQKPIKAEKEEKAEKPKAKPSYKNYRKPPLELMELEEFNDDGEISQEIRENTNIIIETLASFNVTASIKGVDRGPRITRYEVVPAKGVKVNQITNLLDNITMNLAAEGIRMEAPIPGKSAIGFEIPNKNPTNVRLRELLECEEFVNAKSNTFVCIGKDVAGHPVFGDIAKFPHALVAGATGMGKSVCINSIMISLLYKSRPDQIKFIMIDPKKVEFRMYSGIPHLLIPVITDSKQAAGALMWAVEEMERRYDLIEKLNIRNIEAYNEKQQLDPSIGEHMPKIVIVIDELNDLMMQVRDPVEGLIMRIAQKARAAGIHLIIGTQRPDVKVITGTIKANINTRISCKVTSVVDSRTILEMAGAEKLLNRGDMLFKPVDKTKPIRVQGAFVSDNEVEAIMEYLKSQGEGAQYDEEIFAEVNKAAQKCGNKKGGGADADDDGDGEDAVGYYNDQKFLDAVELAIRSGKISTSLLQRKMSIGYGKAAKYIDAMEEIGVVSEANGQKPRDVLISMDQWYDKLSRVDLG